MALDKFGYQNIAAQFKLFQEGKIDYIDLPDLNRAEYGFFGEVIAKERPRKGKGGNMFTPPATRKFEKDVKTWAKGLMKPVNYPIKVDLEIYDATADPLQLGLGSARLEYNMKRDLDNMCKAILDGLNGVLYKDDRQIVNLVASRRYAPCHGFHMEVERCGLTPQEVTNLRKFIK
jgi:Holliday junction resolvase RusA-like endonuclease